MAEVSRTSRIVMSLGQLYSMKADGYSYFPLESETASAPLPPGPAAGAAPAATRPTRPGSTPPARGPARRPLPHHGGRRSARDRRPAVRAHRSRAAAAASVMPSTLRSSPRLRRYSAMCTRARPPPGVLPPLHPSPSGPPAASGPRAPPLGGPRPGPAATRDAAPGVPASPAPVHADPGTGRTAARTAPSGHRTPGSSATDVRISGIPRTRGLAMTFSHTTLVFPRGSEPEGDRTNDA